MTDYTYSYTPISLIAARSRLKGKKPTIAFSTNKNSELRGRVMPIPTLVHLSLMALMVLLCISAAVIARKRAGRWLPRHRLLGLLGAGSGLSGITVMVSGKIAHGYPHLKSPHALLGLSVGILLTLVPLLGFLGSRGFGKMRMPHRLLARILVVLGPVALFTGVLRYLQISRPR